MVSCSEGRFGSPIGSPKSNTIKLKDTVIRSLKPTDKRRNYWFEGYSGFGIRITPKGTKSFFHFYWYRKKKYFITLGRYPKVSLSEARQKYSEATELLELGINPAAKVKKAKSNNLTINELLDKYENYCILQGKKSIEEEMRALRKDLGKKLGSEVARGIDSEDISEILIDVKTRKRKNGMNGSPQMANHLYSYMHRLFSLASKWNNVDENPVSKLEKPAQTMPKDRVLSFQEIYIFWHSLEKANINPIVQMVYKFILVTFQRPIDVRTMMWAYLNRHDSVWVIPQPKNKRSWRVPLNKHAIEILESAADYTSQFEHPFAINNSGPFDKFLLNKNRDSFPIPHFTPHDLRRTAATSVTSVGCPRFWATLMLNHSDNSITSVYDQYQYDYEKEVTVKVWEFVLDRIFEAKSFNDVPNLKEMRELVRKSGLLSYRR